MKLTSYYLHAFDHQNGRPFDGEHSLKALEEILKSGELKSRRLRGDFDASRGGWNGLDYISLCDYRRKDNKPLIDYECFKGYTAYEAFIKQSLSFILKKNKIKAISPEIVPPIIFDYNGYKTMVGLGNDKYDRYSDFVDEVQVKDRISLDRMKGLTIPIEYMITEQVPFIEDEDFKPAPPYTTQEVMDYLKELKQLLTFYQAPSNLYDLETQIELNQEDNIVNAIEKNKEKVKVKKQEQID